jgi:aspartyl-tRNA(Asn)/glutamyl-tRNA(Gln) amidotransferase subunit A
MCGITGLKPTHGQVPENGCVPVAPSLDHIGPMARTAEDCAVLLAAITGSSGRPDTPGALHSSDPSRPLEGLRVGIAEPTLADGEADPAIMAAFHEAVHVLASLGAKVMRTELPDYLPTRAATTMTLRAESYAFHEATLRRHWDDYSRDTRLRLAAGALVSVSEYLRAQQQRKLSRARLADLFTTVDVIATPTSAMPPPRYSLDGTFDRKVMQDAVQVGYWNGVGNPALALPMGCTNGGLPLSLQLAGPFHRDELLLEVGSAYQRATDFE